MPITETLDREHRSIANGAYRDCAVNSVYRGQRFDAEILTRNLLAWSGPWLGQPLEHDGDHGQLGEAYGADGERFVVRHQAAIATQPGEYTLDHPTPADEFQASIFVRTPANLERHGLIG